jgi:hypothetical protein
MAKKFKYNTGRNYADKAVEAAEHLDLLLDAIEGLTKRQAQSLIRLLSDAHRCGYEGAEDIEQPLGRGWTLADTDIIGPLLVKVCENYGIEWPELDGLRNSF